MLQHNPHIILSHVLAAKTCSRDDFHAVCLLLFKNRLPDSTHKNKLPDSTHKLHNQLPNSNQGFSVNPNKLSPAKAPHSDSHRTTLHNTSFPKIKVTKKQAGLTKTQTSEVHPCRRTPIYPHAKHYIKPFKRMNHTRN